MQSLFGSRSQCGLTRQTPPRQSKQVPSGQSLRVGHGRPASMPPSHVEPIEHELTGHWSFIVHMRPAMPGVALGRQNPKPGSRVGVGTIGERLVTSSVLVSMIRRSNGFTLIHLIVPTKDSPTLAMGMGTHG